MNYVEKWLHHRGYGNDNKDLTGFVDVTTAGVIKEFCEAHNFNIKTLRTNSHKKNLNDTKPKSLIRIRCNNGHII